MFRGDYNVGKSCFFSRIKTNKFNCMKSGGFDYFANTKILNNKEIKFHIWDISEWTAWDKALAKHLLRNSDGII